MTKTSPLPIEKPFLSKEINFLKFDSEPEKQSGLQPDNYLSDRIRSREPWMKSFTDRLEKAEIPDNTFTCAVVNHPPWTDTPYGEILDSAIKPDQGLWEKIDDYFTVIALWNKNALAPVLTMMKKKLCSDTGVDPITGSAHFPFMDFSRKETFYNAVKAVDHAAFLGPGSRAVFGDITLNISGDRLYQLGFMDEAAEEYKKGLAINQDNTNLMNSLGVCHGMNNEPEQAKKVFESALKKDPQEVMVVYNMGLVCNILNQSKEALLHLEKASQIDSSIFEVELTAGSLILKQGELDRALVHLTRAKQLNARASLPYRLLGEYFLEIKNMDRAIAEFKQAIKLNPMDAVSLSGLAHAFYLKRKNLKIAITLAKESIRIDPASPLFHSRLGNLYLKTGHKDLAHMAFDLANEDSTGDTSQPQDTREKNTREKKSA